MPLSYEETAHIIIAVDFDGTIVRHHWPTLGPPIPGALHWLRKWQKEGCKIMLWTNRSHMHQGGRDPLKEATDMLGEAGIILWGVNENPDQDWTDSPKQYAHVLVDDVAFGCPLIRPEGGQPYVDWSIVGPAVREMIRQWNEAKVHDHIYGRED